MKERRQGRLNRPDWDVRLTLKAWGSFTAYGKEDEEQLAWDEVYAGLI